MYDLIEPIEIAVNDLYKESTSYCFSMAGKPVIVVDSDFFIGLEKLFNDLKKEY